MSAKFTMQQAIEHQKRNGFGPLLAPGVTKAHCEAGLVAPKQESPLEALFLNLWERAGGPMLEREVELVADRKYRVDFVHELSKTVLEIQGVRDHASVKGFQRDNMKHWELAKIGYRVITWDRKLINATNVADLIKMVTV